MRGMRRVQNHFGIASSSVAPSDIDERDHKRVQDWMLETETIVEEEEEELSEIEKGDLFQTMFGTPMLQQDDTSIPIHTGVFPGTQNKAPHSTAAIAAVAFCNIM